MIAGVIDMALRRQRLVLAAALAICGFGVYASGQLPIDAYPDISPLVAEIVVTYPGQSPDDVDRQVAAPVEQALRTLPNVDHVRSRSIFGLAVVQLIFNVGVDGDVTERKIKDRLATLKLPSGAETELQPLGGSYGEIFRYYIEGAALQDTTALRTLNRAIITPRLQRCPGVADVESFGGRENQVLISFLPTDLDRYGVSLNDIVDAIKSNGGASGGSLVSLGSTSFIVRGRGSLTDLKQIKDTFVKSVGGLPIAIRDIATVGLSAMPANGVFSFNRLDDGVEGIVIMERGANPSRVSADIREAIAELNESNTLGGAVIVPFYDRQTLVDLTRQKVSRSVLIGVALVVLVLLIVLARPTVVGIVALTIPFALLFANGLLYLSGIPLGLLALGAVNFGVIVDGTVVIAEQIAFQLAASRNANTTLTQVVAEAAHRAGRPVLAAGGMVILAYLHLLTLTSIEGLLFRPMVLTMVFAMLGGLLFAVVLTPILAIFVFHKEQSFAEDPVVPVLRARYQALIGWMLPARGFVVAAVLCSLLWIGLRVAPRLGMEFLPSIDEGGIWIRVNFPEGASLGQTAAFGKEIREMVLDFQDVAFVAMQAGRNNAGTDPFPQNRLEILIGSTPRSTWKEFRSRAELAAAVRRRLRSEFPTARLNVTQPILDGVTEDINGSSAELAIEFAGPAIEPLNALARRTADMLRTIPGAQDVAIEQEGPQPQLVIAPDRQLAARERVRIEDVGKLINIAIGGEAIGAIYDDEGRKVNIVAQVDRDVINSPSAVGRLPVTNGDGQRISLAQVARIEVVDGPTIVTRVDGLFCVTVRCDIVGVDPFSFVRAARKRFDVEIQPHRSGSIRVSWLGMFENLERVLRKFT